MAQKDWKQHFELFGTSSSELSKQYGELADSNDGKEKEVFHNWIKRGLIAKTWVLELRQGKKVVLPEHKEGEFITVTTDQELYTKMAKYEQISVKAYQEKIKMAVMFRILWDLLKSNEEAQQVVTQMKLECFKRMIPLIQEGNRFSCMTYLIK